MSQARKSKRFRYQLETLLKVRTIREKQAQEAFQKAEQAHLEEVEKEKKIKDFESEKYEELRDLMSGKQSLTDVQMVMMRKAHLEVLHTQVIQQEERTRQAEELKEQKRLELITTVRNRKIIEKDREKTRESWRKLMDKEAGKFLDDIAVIGFENKSRLKRDNDAAEQTRKKNAS
jgi:flagellar export protein FliJ